MTTMQQIVARASSRVFVGLPLCELPSQVLWATSLLRLGWTGRNQEYLDMAIRCTIDVMKDRVTMNITIDGQLHVMYDDNITEQEQATLVGLYNIYGKCFVPPCIMLIS